VFDEKKEEDNGKQEILSAFKDVSERIYAVQRIITFGSLSRDRAFIDLARER
jgi:predicted nucleotidyltransferase